MPSHRKGGSNSDVFTVERLTNRRVRGNSIEYLVKWQNWSDKHNSWEPESNILDKRLIENYHERVSRKAAQKRSKALRCKQQQQQQAHTAPKVVVSPVREIPLPTRPSSELKRPAKQRAELEISAMEKQSPNSSLQHNRPKICLTIPRDRILPPCPPTAANGEEDSSLYSCDEPSSDYEEPQTSGSPPHRLPSFSEDPSGTTGGKAATPFWTAATTTTPHRNLSCEVELPRRSTTPHYSLDYPPPPKLEAVHISEAEEYDELNISTNSVTPRGPTSVGPTTVPTTTSSATTPLQDDNNNRSRKKKKKKSSKRLRSPSSQSSRRHKHHKKHRRRSSLSPLSTPSPASPPEQGLLKLAGGQSENRRLVYQPSPARVKVLHDITLTDVTVNNLTITFKECCSGSAGFFGQPSPYAASPSVGQMHRKEPRRSAEKKKRKPVSVPVKEPVVSKTILGVVETTMKPTTVIKATPNSECSTTTFMKVVEPAKKSAEVELPKPPKAAEDTKKQFPPVTNAVTIEDVLKTTKAPTSLPPSITSTSNTEAKPSSPQVSDAKVTSTSVSTVSTKDADTTTLSTSSPLKEDDVKIIKVNESSEPPSESLSSFRHSPVSSVEVLKITPPIGEMKQEDDVPLIVDDDDEEDRALTIDLNPPTPVATPPVVPPPAREPAPSSSVRAPNVRSLARLSTVADASSSDPPGVAIVPPQPQTTRKSHPHTHTSGSKRPAKCHSNDSTSSSISSDAKLFKASAPTAAAVVTPATCTAAIATGVNSQAALYMSMYMRGNPYQFGYSPAPPCYPTTSDFYRLASAPSPAHLCPSLGPYATGHHAYPPLFQSQAAAAALFHQQQAAAAAAVQHQQQQHHQQQQQIQQQIADDSPIDLSRKL